MQTGKAIKTFDHMDDWCLTQKKRVIIKSRSGGVMMEHSFKVVAKMTVQGLKKMMDDGRLFESHYE